MNDWLIIGLVCFLLVANVVVWGAALRLHIKTRQESDEIQRAWETRHGFDKGFLGEGSE